MSIFFRGKKIFLTGHTGFKGGWLALWLHALGAKVHGFAIDPPTRPNFFTVAKIADVMQSDTRADLADLPALRMALTTTQPEIIFHLAAQALVRGSYKNPLETLQTNIMGTAHLLEAARNLPGLQAIVIVTTDKVYAGNGNTTPTPYRETDALGGADPYSASKAAVEIVTDSYRKSFFTVRTNKSTVNIATARAGNVIGGGDWAPDRLLPDCLREFENGRPVRLRYPSAIRPWQHVLEPLHGYLMLGARLAGPDGARFAKAWNFGPTDEDRTNVIEVAQRTAGLWGGNASIKSSVDKNNPHESDWLRLDTTQARDELGWQPLWPLQKALQATVDWHKAWLAGEDMRQYSLSQINAYYPHINQRRPVGDDHHRP